MIPQDLTYISPQAAFAFFLVFIPLWLAWSLFMYRNTALHLWGDPKVLQRILVERPHVIYWSKVGMLSMVWLLCVAALMGPQGNAHYPEEKQGQKKKPQVKNVEVKLKRRFHNVIFLIDASASMSVTDTYNQTSRLDTAKDIADQTIRRLSGEQSTLFAFTSQPTLMSPVTMDYLFLRLMVRSIDINEGGVAGTDFFSSIQEVQKKYLLRPSTELKTLVILSDGEDTSMEGLQGELLNQKMKSLFDLIEGPQMNLRVITVGIGSSKGGMIPGLIFEGHSVHSSLDEELMRRLAAHGRGIYLPAREFTAISLAEEIIKDINQDNPYQDETSLITSLTANQQTVYDLYYQYPLGIALLLLGMVLLWPDTKQRKGTPENSQELNAAQN